MIISANLLEQLSAALNKLEEEKIWSHTDELEVKISDTSTGDKFIIIEHKTKTEEN